jgi:ABC-type glutathione transport system ATPase component
MYSSGMFVRLAFAVAINVDPDILIIDEALSVGDMRFQQKCFRKIEELKQSKTILFVSHDLAVINKYCNRAIWINEGVMMDDSTPEIIAKQYQAFMMGSSLTKYHEIANNAESKHAAIHVTPIPESLDVLGDNQARITGVALVDNHTDDPISLVSPGQWVKLLISVKANSVLLEPIVGFSVKDKLGNIVTQSNSYVLEKIIDEFQFGETYTFGFVFQFPALTIGEYTISPAVASGTQEDHQQHSWIHDALVIQVMDLRKHHLNGYMSLNEIEFYQFD